MTDIASLREFLYGQLWTVGALSACAAAAICARTQASDYPESVWRSAEAELDARLASPAARQASRRLGGRMLRQALSVTSSPVFDALIHSTTPSQQQPHEPVVVGAVAAVAGHTPLEAAEAAAYASLAGSAFAARAALHLPARGIAQLGVELAPEVRRLAREANATCLLPLSQLPSVCAPVMDYLFELDAELAGLSQGATVRSA